MNLDAKDFNAANITFKDDPRCPPGWVIAWNGRIGNFEAYHVGAPSQRCAGHAASLAEVYGAIRERFPEPV